MRRSLLGLVQPCSRSGLPAAAMRVKHSVGINHSPQEFTESPVIQLTFVDCPDHRRARAATLRRLRSSPYEERRDADSRRAIRNARMAIRQINRLVKSKPTLSGRGSGFGSLAPEVLLP